jgi:glycerol-3-phosphate dehydrogenase (NAD+)
VLIMITPPPGSLLCRFPLFTAVYQICFEGRAVGEMISCLQSHPEHL